MCHDGDDVGMRTVKRSCAAATAAFHVDLGCRDTPIRLWRCPCRAAIGPLPRPPSPGPTACLHLCHPPSRERHEVGDIAVTPDNPLCPTHSPLRAQTDSVSKTESVYRSTTGCPRSKRSPRSIGSSAPLRASLVTFALSCLHPRLRLHHVPLVLPLDLYRQQHSARRAQKCHHLQVLVLLPPGTCRARIHPQRRRSLLPVPVGIPRWQPHP